MNSCVTVSDVGQIIQSVLPWVCVLVVALVLLAIYTYRLIESLVKLVSPPRNPAVGLGLVASIDGSEGGK
jgi:peptidoglycan/LPS O-acetylase OafA/YrhL